MLEAAKVAKWKVSDWNTKVKYARPSKGGAVGVLFCWTTQMRSYDDNDNSDCNYANPATCDFIVKPIKGGAAPTLFAEEVMGMIADTGSPNSKPIKRDSKEGHAIAELAQKWQANSTVYDYDGRVPVRNDTDARKRVDENSARWTQVLGSYLGADYFLIQNNIQDQKELADEYRSNRGLIEFIADDKLMVNLGKLFVADAILGNGDRLSQINTGNILYSSKGKFWSIDSSTVLTVYKEVFEDYSQMSWGGFIADPGSKHGPPAHQWAQDIINNTSTSTPRLEDKYAYDNLGAQPFTMPGFSLATIFDPAKWWTHTFKQHFEDKFINMTQENDRENQGRHLLPTKPSDKQWERAFTSFNEGVVAGLVEVDQKLSGLNWSALRTNYKAYTKKYGGDSNVDWTNFKIRRLYIRSRRSSGSHEFAMARVHDYVQRKYAVLY